MDEMDYDEDILLELVNEISKKNKEQQHLKNLEKEEKIWNDVEKIFYENVNKYSVDNHDIMELFQYLFTFIRMFKHMNEQGSFIREQGNKTESFCSLYTEYKENIERVKMFMDVIDENIQTLVSKQNKTQKEEKVVDYLVKLNEDYGRRFVKIVESIQPTIKKNTKICSKLMKKFYIKEMDNIIKQYIPKISYLKTIQRQDWDDVPTEEQIVVKFEKDKQFDIDTKKLIHILDYVASNYSEKDNIVRIQESLDNLRDTLDEYERLVRGRRIEYFVDYDIEDIPSVDNKLFIRNTQFKPCETTIECKKRIKTLWVWYNLERLHDLEKPEEDQMNTVVNKLKDYNDHFNQQKLIEGEIQRLTVKAKQLSQSLSKRKRPDGSALFDDPVLLEREKLLQQNIEKRREEGGSKFEEADFFVEDRYPCEEDLDICNISLRRLLLESGNESDGFIDNKRARMRLSPYTDGIVLRKLSRARDGMQKSAFTKLEDMGKKKLERYDELKELSGIFKDISRLRKRYKTLDAQDEKKEKEVDNTIESLFKYINVDAKDLTNNESDDSDDSDDEDISSSVPQLA